MSWQRAMPPETQDAGSCAAIDTVIVPRMRDLGGFEVGRVLPSAQRQMVGPFIFFDQIGPATFPPGRGIDVRPHPHIGLATVTYLFDGTIVHRDSLGSLQPITPGDVNWMTAGRGIVHSERSDPDIRKREEKLAGIQIWVALPKRHEETAPGFAHHNVRALPLVEGEGKSVRVVAGTIFGQTSPVKILSDLYYADVTLDTGASVSVESEHEERAAYLVDGRIEADGTTFDPGRLLVFRAGSEVSLKAPEAARLLLFGGEPMDGPRHIWWNFVSSSKERIEQAKDDWRNNRFGTVPGDSEFIPLPEKP